MPDVHYSLAETVVHLDGTVHATTDAYAESPTQDFATAEVTVSLVNQAEDEIGASRTFSWGTRGDDDYTIQLTPDARLVAVAYKNAGVGARVLTAGATVIAFVGSLIGAAVRAATHMAPAAVERDVAEAGTSQPAEVAPEDQSSLTPDDRARADWEGTHTAQVQLIEKYTKIVDDGMTAVADQRLEALQATSVADQTAAAARVIRLEHVVNDSRNELEKLEAAYDAWRAGTKTDHIEELEFTIDVDALEAHRNNRIPTPATWSGDPRDAWERLGIAIEREDDLPPTPVHRPPFGDFDTEAGLLRWRVPRPVRLWIWKRSEDGSPYLSKTAVVRVVDEHCDTVGVELDKTIFGEHGGELQFNDDGTPSKVALNDKSGIGAAADALAGLPAAIATSVENAKKVQETYTGMEDAQAERAKVAAERDLAIARAQLDLKGLRATEADYAELQRAEQAVKLHAATTALSPASLQLEDLKRQLEVSKTQSDLESTKRAQGLEAGLADLRAAVARAELEAKQAKEKSDLESTERARALENDLATLKAEVARLEELAKAAKALHDAEAPGEPEPGE